MNSFIHGNNTSDIRLVAALGAMGIKCDEQNAGGALQTRSGVVRTWNLSQVSNCGKWKLGELLSWWRDREFHTTNPSHVFMRVKSAMASCKGFSELLTVHAGIHTVKRGDTLIAVASSTPNIHPVNPPMAAPIPAPIRVPAGPAKLPIVAPVPANCKPRDVAAKA